MLEKIAKWIAYHPKTVIIIAVALLVPSAIGYFCTGVNYDILSYLPEKLESVQGERILDETFNNASSSIIIMENYTPKNAARLKEKIEGIDGVHSVMWADSILDISVPQEIYPDVLNSVFYSKDGKSTMMMVQYIEAGSSQRTMNAIKEIRKVMDKNTFMSGISAITVDTKELADSQAPLYIAIAIALALAVLMFTMKSFVLPFVLLTALGVAVIYNMGTNIVFGSISYITQCIAAILQLGVTMDYSVFLMDRFEEECTHYDDKRDAMATAIKSTFASLAGSSLTTVFGFVALCFMQFTLGIDIGLVMAKGVVLGVVTVITFLPALILLLDKLIIKTRHKSLVPSFSKLNSFTIKHRRVMAIICALLFIPAFLIESQLKLYYDMSKALPEDTASISALSKMKEQFNMATTHFIICDENLSSSDMADMITEIDGIEGIENVLSLSEIVGSSIPLSVLPDSVRNICVAGGKQLMMINSSYSAATDEENAQIEQLKTVMKKYDPEAYLTGEGVLTKDLIEVTNTDFMVTSIISIAAIFILIAVCLKSVSLPIILVAAIELAIMLNKACSAATGAILPFIAPTIIGCVQLGATVDYAILFATRFREEMRKNPLNKTEAMLVTANESSRSVFQSAMVFFAATFGVNLICDISIVKSICMLLARGSLISAFVIIVFMTPVLTCCEGLISRTTLHWRSEKKAKIKKIDNKTEEPDKEAVKI